MGSPSVVIIADNTSPDILAGVLAATHPTSGLNVVAVIITGRLVHPNPAMPLTAWDPVATHEIHVLNTRRMQGFLNRAGRRVPVFRGLVPPATVIPHARHVNEHHYDLHNDYQHTREAGDFEAALQFLRQLRDPFQLMVGGPFTEARAIMRDPSLAGKLSIMMAQGFTFEESQAAELDFFGGPHQSFNSVCDLAAAEEIWLHYPAGLYIMPGNITKHPAVSFAHPDELARLRLYPELVEVYRQHYQLTAKPHGRALALHDFYLAVLAIQLRQEALYYPGPTAAAGPYTYQTVAATLVDPNRPPVRLPWPRYLVTAQKISEHRRLMRYLLRS